MKEEFFDLLVEAIAREVAQSSIITTSVSRELVKDPQVVARLTANIDASMLGKELARLIIAEKDNNKMYSSSRSSYSQIMREAKEVATKLVAEDIAEDTLNA